MAIAEQTVSQEEINRFKMPEVEEGTVVFYYPPYVLDGSKPSIGFVEDAHERTVRLIVPGASPVRRTAVRHLDDPKLQMNNDQREAGAWDFTPAWKTEHTWRGAVNVALNMKGDAAAPCRGQNQQTCCEIVLRANSNEPMSPEDIVDVAIEGGYKPAKSRAAAVTGFTTILEKAVDVFHSENGKFRLING